jgi:hypothetical protein
MKKKKLIIFVNQLLNKHNCDRFDINNSNNEDVIKEFWCLLPITNKKLYKAYNSKEFRAQKNKNFKIITSYYELLKKCLDIKDNHYYINWAHGFRFNYFLEIILKIQGAKKIHRFFTNINKTIENKIKKKNLKLKLKLLIKNYLNFFLPNVSLYFVESQLNFNQVKEIENNHSKIIRINSFDYSAFKKINQKQVKKKHILFLDSNIEKSYESQLLNYKKRISLNDYWNTMKKIFSLYEKKYNKKVIIASHFRRSIKNQPISKKFYFDKTTKLISESMIVLGHFSQSIHWAVYFKKPITLIYFKEFEKILFSNKQMSDFYRKNLDLNRINVDEQFKFNYKINSKELKINKKKYTNFEKLYLSNSINNTKEINGWDTITETIKLD